MKKIDEKNTCLECGKDISNLHKNSKRCKDCKKIWRNRDRHRIDYQKEYWKNNKHKYQKRWIRNLGNPEQDKEILDFLRKKRNGEIVPDYNALGDSSFTVTNQAYESYPEDIIQSEDASNTLDLDYCGVCSYSRENYLFEEYKNWRNHKKIVPSFLIYGLNLISIISNFSGHNIFKNLR